MTPIPVDQVAQISADSIMDGSAAAIELVAAFEALPDLERAYIAAYTRRAANTFTLAGRPELAAVFDRIGALAADEHRRRPGLGGTS